MVSTTGDKVLTGPEKGKESEVNYLNIDRSLLSWLLSLDHKRIGVMYLISIVLFFLVGGSLAFIIRLELTHPAGKFISDDVYNKLFTLHGAIMIFLFLIPSIPAALGNFILPISLGAKDVAFPRLNLASFYIYVFGALFLIGAILVGGLDTGWTFYTPYSSKYTSETSAVLFATLGVFILGFSSILTGINFIVTIHKLRAPGMTWGRLPLFAWALYATSVIQILATPVLAITVLLLFFEQTFKIGIFNPSYGGDPVLFQHFFWFYSHPAVYIMVLPAFGVISEIVPVHSRKRIFGYKFIAGSSMAIALIGFLVWGHHMFVSGQSELASTIFSFLTFAVAIPTAIKVFSWVATLYKGRVKFTTPMVYALTFVFLFAIGGLTGLFLATLATNVHLHDTYFVVGHFHYVMVGGVLTAFLGALHHWWPKMFGRKYNEKLGIFASLLIFIGFNITFFVQLILGTKGMPRRYHTYHMLSSDLVPLFQKLHFISTVGTWFLTAGILLVLLYLIHSLIAGEKAESNPWGGASLEWQTTSPPHPHNFEEIPTVTHGPYEYPEIDRSQESEKKE